MQITENSPRLRTLVKTVSEYAKGSSTPTENLIVQVVNEGLASLEGEFEKAIGWTRVVSERVGVSEMVFRRKRGSSTKKGKGKCFLTLDISI